MYKSPLSPNIRKRVPSVSSIIEHSTRTMNSFVEKTAPSTMSLFRDPLTPQRPKSVKKKKKPTSSVSSVSGIESESMSLIHELQQWNQTWTRLVAMLSNVVPFPPNFPQTTEAQRQLLEDLTQSVCQIAANPVQSDQYRVILQKLENKSAKLQEEREQNHALSEELLQTRALFEKRLKEVNERTQSVIESRIKDLSDKITKNKADTSTQAKSKKVNWNSIPTSYASPSLLKSKEKAKAQSPKNKISYIVEVQRSSASSVNNDSDSYIGSSSYKKRSKSESRKSTSSESSDLDMIASAVSQAFAERERNYKPTLRKASPPAPRSRSPKAPTAPKSTTPRKTYKGTSKKSSLRSKSPKSAKIKQRPWK